MSKLLRQNVGGTDYSMVGCALTATCATPAATAAKVATLTDGDTLADGMSVVVQFTEGNTAASPLTLTVGGVTANICDSRGQNIGGNIWQAGNIVTFLYTFGKFLLLNCVVDEVTSNNMNSVTSNAVFQRLNAESTMFYNLPVTDVTINTQCILHYRKVTTHLVELVMIPSTQDLVVPNVLTQIATLPEGFRPALFTFEANIEGRIKSGSTMPSRFTVDTDGKVCIVNYGLAETINSPYNTYFFSI